MNYSRPETGWRLVTAPTSSPMSVDEAKAHLRIDFDDDDDYIQTLIDAATGWIENHGYALMPQTWDMTIDCFPQCEPILIFRQPVQSVDSVEYVDADGSTQTFTDYQASLTTNPPRILPAYGTSWPSTRAQMEAVTVRITSGYNSSPVAIPGQFLQGMKLLIGHLYENREAVVIMQGIVSLELPIGLEALIENVIGQGRVY